MDFRSAKDAMGKKNKNRSLAPPRLYEIMKIDHSAGQFWSGESNIGKEIDVIMLGLIRQRTLWPPKDSKRSRPDCESPDFEHGYAKIDTFPWKDTDFVEPIGGGTRPHELPCDQCPLRNWQDRTPPRCAQVWNVPVIYGAGLFVIPFSASALSDLENYMRPFRDSRTPLYTVITRIKLSRVEKKGRRYVVPHFSQTANTDTRVYPEYSSKLNQVKEVMQQKPETAMTFKPMSMGSKGPQQPQTPFRT